MTLSYQRFYPFAFQELRQGENQIQESMGGGCIVFNRETGECKSYSHKDIEEMDARLQKAFVEEVERRHNEVDAYKAWRSERGLPPPTSEQIRRRFNWPILEVPYFEEEREITARRGTIGGFR